jgi:hypothetical protein
MGLNPLVEKISAKYPEYNDIDDATLTEKVLAKYPEYEDLAIPHSLTQPQVPRLTDNAQAFGPSGVITPKPGELFQQTIKCAAAAGKTVTPEEITGQTIEGVKKSPELLGSAAGIGVIGPAALAGAGELASATVSTVGPSSPRCLERRTELHEVCSCLRNPPSAWGRTVRQEAARDHGRGE